MSGKLAILGAGGNGRVIADAAQAAGWHEIFFFDDRFPNLTQSGPWAVVGTGQDLIDGSLTFDGVIAGVGDNAIRWDMHTRLKNAGANLVTVEHPHAWCSQYAQIGEGTFISAGVVISIGAVVGECCIVNTGATIDHDCAIGHAVHIAPGVHMSGGVKIGDNSLVGIGTSIRPAACIGANVIIGAGSVVVSDIADDTVAIGCPAKSRN